MSPPSVRRAAAELAAADPVMAELVGRFGPPPRRRPVPVADRFASLAEIVVYQQLAGRAAATIHGRFVAGVGGRVTPASVLAAPEATLAAAGLSRAKASAIRDLAERVVAGDVALERLGRQDDDAVVAHLTRVRGIGPWSAHMFLMGPLGRLDVWPTGDYGVRAGVARAWGLDAVPSARELEPHGDPFRPYRSLVAWYCWRVVDQADQPV